MTTAPTDLVSLLKQKQDELALRDAEFAKLLGVQRTAWVQVRNGARDPGVQFLGGVVKAFPTLADVCLVYMRDR